MVLQPPAHPGATAATYSIPAAAPANIGVYFVVVTNSVGSATSSNATLTVHSTMAAVVLHRATARPGSVTTRRCQ